MVSRQTVTLRKILEFIQHDEVKCVVDVELKFLEDFEYFIKFVPHGTMDDKYDHSLMDDEDDGEDPSSSIDGQKECFDNHAVFVRAKLMSEKKIKERVNGIVHFSLLLTGLIIVMVISQSF